MSRFCNRLFKAKSAVYLNFIKFYAYIRIFVQKMQ